ncbi:hypothetical protein [Butyrivibrio sp. AE3004]|uniref:hypothetical protein n=1 Tax=Butyrivibrio sp. AE3004 TaxID=1506994 RepID=UPI0004946116|nr:hypothetical protein [Butyrivibrio sp. AE3004]
MIGGDGLLNVLIQTIRSRMTGLVTKFRLYTNWNFIKTKIVARLRDFFAALLGVKPRNKHDYYTIGRWMISKRLVYAFVIIIGVISIWYITTESTLFKRFAEDGIKTYNYDSFRLRMAKGHVKIKGKSGYLAYDGNVQSGFVEGEGTLFNKEGTVIYTGNFSENKYEGEGTQNYNSGVMHYRGGFHENIYEGKGTLYREDGTTEYVGDFSQGMKNGTGVLYDRAENELYTGTFSSDSIVYSELLGKTASEVAECYKGKGELFTASNESVYVMQGINALYHAEMEAEALDESEVIDSVYVLSDIFNYGNIKAKTLGELEELFGDPVYEGNTGVIFPEAVAINRINSERSILQGNVKMDTEQPFTDVTEVNSFDHDYAIYVYSFKKGDNIYSFVTNGINDGFEFYYITGTEGEGA